jgi:hypothetical protein
MRSPFESHQSLSLERRTGVQADDNDVVFGTEPGRLCRIERSELGTVVQLRQVYIIAVISRNSDSR